MNEGVQQLVEWIKGASPILWGAAYRQVFINGIEELFCCGISVVAACWGYRYGIKNWDHLEEGKLFVVLGVALAVICSIGFFTDVIDYFANPTFAAIHELAKLTHK